MPSKLTPEELDQLSQSFQTMASDLGDYLDANWNTLTEVQREELEASRWKLADTASKLNAESVILKAEMLEEQIEILRNCTAAMKTAAAKLTSVHRALTLAAKAVAFGGTLFLSISTGNVSRLVSDAKELLELLKA